MLDSAVATVSRDSTAPAAPPVRPDPYRIALLVAAPVIGLYVWWLLADVGGAGLRMLVSDLLFINAPLVAACACWAAHRSRGGRHTGWAWLTVGCLTWAAGAVVWACYELLLGIPSPFPSYADLGYVLYAIPIAIGVTRFPRASGSTWARWRLTLDGVVIAGSLLMVSFIWVLAPVVEATDRTFTRLDALAYPLADVAVASAVLTRCMVVPQTRRLVWLLLSAGLLVLSVTDSIYIAQTFREGGFESGGILDLGWVLSFVLIALAALAPTREPLSSPASEQGDPPTLVQQLLPYVAIGAAAASVFGDPSMLGSPSRWAWLGVPLVVAIGVRQFVVAADHATLARDLAEAVERRTEQLRHREQWWRDLVQNLSDVVVVIDTEGGIRYCSPSAGSALGHWPQQAASAYDLQSHVHPADLDEVLEVIRPVLAGRMRHGFVECRIERADGSWGWFEVTTVGQLTERALHGTVLTLHDVSERRRLTDQLTHEAHHDALTGLPNRTLLMKRVEHALAHPGSHRAALLLIDLDDFKVINDRHGHAAGDLVLEVIGRRLRKTVRAGDTVARLGGDEFALLMNGTGAQVHRTAGRLIEQIGKPVVAGGRRFLVRASVGVVFAGEDESETAQSMLSHADIALYEAKARDKGGIVVIEGHERDAAAKQVHLREQIAQPALEQFSVVYQPIVDLTTGWVRGVESLLRWNHPDLGSVPPDDFIPMAEAGGSIQYLGWHVLNEACAQLAKWKAEAPDHRLAVGVNVSSRQLDEPGFATRVLDLITEHGIDPALIVLELTEQSLSVDFETAVSVVAELRAGEVSVAVDDYGTGYSSLRYLHRFDADVVKIDRSFIANLEGSVHTQKIVRSVMDMANSLDLQSIAEGIETPVQLELIRALGCELGQGYLFSRPVPPEEISAMLAAGEGFAAATGPLPMPAG
ncbi:MAG: putative bifunctional diguanylate cyclase/phosphodiesterase [Nocardioides sp.]